MNEYIYQYISRNKRLIHLNGKIPLNKEWVNSNLSEEEIISHNGNHGWALDPTDLIIDVDPRNGGRESFVKLLKDIESELFPTVITPSGGFHIYLSKVASQGTHKRLKDYPGIDFLSYGSQCVIAGSKIGDNHYCWYDSIFDEFISFPVPEKLIKLLSNEEKKSYAFNQIEDLMGKNLTNISASQIMSFLDKIDAGCPYDKWIKIGMALQSWDHKIGLEVWEKWSKNGNNYEEGATFKHWKSFNEDKSISIGTLIHYAKETDNQSDSEEFENFKIKITETSSKKEIEDIIVEIRLKNYDEVEKEILAQTIQTQYKTLMGVRVPIKEIRGQLNRQYGIIEAVERNWWEKWLYVNSHNAFMNINNRQFYRTESFNILNGKNIPPNENGNKISATKFISDEGLIDHVNAITYMPQNPDLIIDLDGQKIFNIFNPNTVPIPAKYFTDGGLSAIEIIKEHINLICNNNEINTKLLTQWLAHQVQHMGEKILWSPIIQAIQGVGKSFFGELLRCCIGDGNVGTINPMQVTSQFNGWSKGVAVNVLEELRVVGHNRFEVINALKPLITDRVIQINEKGVKQFITYNTANYICFTNYKDSIPIDGDDRRWWVIFTNITELKQIENITGKTLNKYFTDLFDSLKYYGSEVKKWLLEYDITKEFEAIKQAPETNFKLSMINTENNNIEGLFEIKELLSEGAIYFNEEIVDTAVMFDKCIEKHPELINILTNRHKNKIMKILGYTLFGTLKFHNKVRKIWTKTALNRTEIIEKLLLSEKNQNISSSVSIDITEL